MRATAIILLIILLPALCFANGKVAAIKKGQTAPFDGILLDKKAEATMAAKRESAVKICEIDKNYTIKKLKAECDFDKRFLTIEKESEYLFSCWDPVKTLTGSYKPCGECPKCNELIEVKK